MGGKKLVLEILQIFRTQTRQRLSEIMTAHQNRDFETLERSAHSLKSSSAYVGATELRALCERMEGLAEEKQGLELLSLLKPFEMRVEEALQYTEEREGDYRK